MINVSKEMLGTRQEVKTCPAKARVMECKIDKIWHAKA